VLHLQIADSVHPLHEWSFDVPIKILAQWSFIALGVVAALAAAVAAILIYYARTYRHPLVVRLSGAPADLVSLDVEELPRARRLLARTGRLDTVLRGAESAQAWLDAASGFAIEIDPPNVRRFWQNGSRLMPSPWERMPRLPPSGWNCRRISRSTCQAVCSRSPSPASLRRTSSVLRGA
jgi:hypothetical protein